jgi:hypothetical protein
MENLSKVKETQAVLEQAGVQIASAKRGARITRVLFWVAAILIVLAAWIGAFTSWRFSVPLGIALGVVGLSISAVAIYRMLRETPVDLSKLKGASPFGIEDGELFSGFGRQGKVTQLLDLVLSHQVGVILVWGPSGVGKTSVVTAGLKCALKDDQQKDRREFIYVDASYDNFEKALLAEISQRLSPGEAVPKSLEEAIVSDPPREQVVVIDNVDLSSKTGEIREWVKLALMQEAPFTRVFVLVLDKDAFVQSWSKEDWPQPRALEDLEIKRFKKGEAKAVAAALCDKAQLAVSDRLIDEIINGIATGPGHGAEVSPLSLSVLIQTIGKVSMRRFGMRSYRDAGYAAGLMGAYIQECLSSRAPQHAQDILTAIARQINIGSQTFRASDLGVSTMDTADLSRLLGRLSSPGVHILRANHDYTQFKIYDDWLPALRAYVGSPNPEIAFLEDHVTKKYRWWHDGQTFAGGGMFGVLTEGRSLLTRDEVKRFRRNRGSFRFEGDPSILGYISRSRKYRAAQLGGVLLLAAIFISGSALAYRAVHNLKGKTFEKGWGLPRDLARYGNQLRELSVVCMVDDLKWLPRKLTSLEANCERITSLQGVPPHLRHLGISLTKVRSLDYLPESVTELDVHGAALSELDGIGRNKLTKLDASGIAITNMKLIPRSVTDLKLQHSSINNLEGLPDVLTDLVLRGTRVTNLRSVPNNVRRLTLAKNGDLKIDSLPIHLESLETDNFPEHLQLPSSLATLILSDTSVINVPSGVTSLELRKTLVEGELPKGLDSLKMDDAFSTLPLTKIPGTIHHLKMRWPPGTSFALLPKHLVELDLRLSQDLSSIAGIGQVTDLDISSTLVQDLRDVPDSVTTLHFELCNAVGLTKFPTGVQKVYLGGCSKLDLIEGLPESVTVLDVSGTALSALPKLPSKLTTLDISNTQILGHLPELPEGLEELILHAGQINTLEGLPKSVKKLRFKWPNVAN